MKAGVNNIMSKSQFSSVLAKFGVCFLLVGLAYRLLTSSFVEFVPVGVADTSSYAVDKASPPPVSEPPVSSDPPLVLHAEKNQTSQNAKCNIFLGDWIPDPTGPIYTNNTCRTIEDHQNCMKNGRPDTGYIYWRWKPRDCDLPKFDAINFLYFMRNKAMAFIGDSIMRNHVQSLLCTLSQVNEDYRPPSFGWCIITRGKLGVKILAGSQSHLFRIHRRRMDIVDADKLLAFALRSFVVEITLFNEVEYLQQLKVEEAVEVYHDKYYHSRRWYFPSYKFSLSVVWSPFLVKASILEDDNGVSTGAIQLHVDEVDTEWTEQYENFDYVLIAGGKWYLKTAIYYENNTVVGCHNCPDKNITELGPEYAYQKALNSVLSYVTQSKHNAYAFLRTTTPDHFENGEWNTGGYCNRTLPFKEGEGNMTALDQVMRKIELEEFERASAKASGQGLRLKLFDTTFLSLLRADGHPGVYRQYHPYAGKDRDAKIQNDCLHWCLPGPIDSWNDLIWQLLRTG